MKRKAIMAHCIATENMNPSSWAAEHHGQTPVIAGDPIYVELLITNDGIPYTLFKDGKFFGCTEKVKWSVVQEVQKRPFELDAKDR